MLNYDNDGAINDTERHYSSAFWHITAARNAEDVQWPHANIATKIAVYLTCDYKKNPKFFTGVQLYIVLQKCIDECLTSIF